MMNKNQKTALAGLAVCHFAVLVIGAFYRFVDGDEGGYLTASKEVISGRIPILDINAHNQPLLYYFYGAWMKLFGFTIVSGRFLSVLAIFGAGLMLVWWVKRYSENFWSTLIIYLLFIANLTFYKSNIPVKPFALSNFFIFASFAIISVSYLKNQSFSYKSLFASGLMLGFAMGVRLIFLLPMVFAFWLIVVMYRDRTGVKDILKKNLVFAAAVAIPMLPAIAIFLQEPLRAYAIWGGAYAQIYFGNGSNPDFAVNALQDVKAEMTIRGILEVIRTPDVLFLITLLGIALVLFISKCRNIAKPKTNVYILACIVFLSIILVYSRMYLSYIGYANQVVLFALVLTVPLAEYAARYLNIRRFIVISSCLFLTLTAVTYFHFQKKLKTSLFYVLKSGDTIITPGFVSKVSDDVIKKFSKEDDIVLDTWGVFVFASGRKPLKGHEYPNDSSIFWQFMPKREAAAKYLYISETEFLETIEKKAAPVVVIGDDKELKELIYDEKLIKPDPGARIRGAVEKNYVLYEKYFVKPTNAWLLIYVLKK